MILTLAVAAGRIRPYAGQDTIKFTGLLERMHTAIELHTSKAIYGRSNLFKNWVGPNIAISGYYVAGNWSGEWFCYRDGDAVFTHYMARIADYVDEKKEEALGKTFVTRTLMLA